MFRRMFYVALVSFALASCAACPSTGHNPKLSESDVVAIANRAAKASGADLSQFHEPDPHYEYVSRNCTWSVFYQGIRPTIGNHFLVIVNDCTRATQLSGGL